MRNRASLQAPKTEVRAVEVSGKVFVFNSSSHNEAAIILQHEPVLFGADDCVGPDIRVSSGCGLLTSREHAYWTRKTLWERGEIAFHARHRAGANENLCIQSLLNGRRLAVIDRHDSDGSPFAWNNWFIWRRGNFLDQDERPVGPSRKVFRLNDRSLSFLYLLPSVIRVETGNQDQNECTNRLHPLGPVFLAIACITVLFGGHVVMLIALRHDGKQLFAYCVAGVSIVGVGMVMLGWVDPVSSCPALLGRGQ